MIALLASWIGAIILTGSLAIIAMDLDRYADRLIAALIRNVDAQRVTAPGELKALADTLKIVVESQSWALLGTLAILGLILLGLGFAINRREFEADLGKWARFKSSGGDSDHLAPPPKVRTTTETEVIPPERPEPT